MTSHTARYAVRLAKTTIQSETEKINSSKGMGEVF